MHLRNDRYLVLLLVLLCLAFASDAQTTPAQQPAANNQPAPTSTTATPSTTGRSAPPAASSSAGQTGAPASTTPAPAQGTSATPVPAAQAQQDPQQGMQAPPDQQDQTQAPPDQSQAPANDNSTFVFKTEVQNVILHATVVDDKNHLVMNLPKDAFTVFENNQPQRIVSFAREDVPVAMGIVIDNSGSMREKRDKVNKAAINLVRSSNPQDQVFVVNFNDEYYLDQPFTGNVNLLKEALEKVEARGGTALYDALVASADYLKKNARLQKKVLFVVTDGADNASRETLEEAVRRLQEENGPSVYAIGLLGEEKERRARRALETLAQRTGGIAFLPKTVDEVDEISRTVAHDIRSQYIIGYKPMTPKSVGGYRTIHVEARAKGMGKLTVRTRSGYYPGQEQSQ
ncbi:MAG TPA: VWA domain-containing protein [Terriglobales bacterium]|nr:VWA domain-containing protein [Terriglobales bacterium]